MNDVVLFEKIVRKIKKWFRYTVVSGNHSAVCAYAGYCDDLLKSCERFWICICNFMFKLKIVSKTYSYNARKLVSVTEYWSQALNMHQDISECKIGFSLVEIHLQCSFQTGIYSVLNNLLFKNVQSVWKQSIPWFKRDERIFTLCMDQQFRIFLFPYLNEVRTIWTANQHELNH